MNRKACVILLAAAVLLSLGTGGIACSSVDTEESGQNVAVGWTPLTWEQSSLEDFTAGTRAGTDIATYPGDIVLQSSWEGSFTSEMLDTGKAGTVLDHAFWDRTLPAGTSVLLEVRANNTLTGGAPSGGWHALGDGVHGSLENVTGRYVQWRATLTSDALDKTPVLEEVRIYYRLA